MPSSEVDAPSVPVAKSRRKRRVGKLARSRAVPTKNTEEVEEELATAMVEKMIEEDEKAAAAVSVSAGPGYAMIALQEQLMLLKAQVEAIQKSAVEEPSVSSPLPPPVPPRDDQEITAVLLLEDQVGELPQVPQSEDSGCPAAPPPPEPFKTPGLRRASSSVADTPQQQTQQQQVNDAPLSELIRDKSRGALKMTGVPRSPGGTPLRRHSVNLNNGSPRGLLSSALNRKFRSVRLPESPVAKMIGAQSSDDEWENVEN